MVICLGRSADLHTAQLVPQPLNISCSSKSRLVHLPGSTFLVVAHMGSPGQSLGGRKMVVVVVVFTDLILHFWLKAMPSVH